MTTKPIDDGGAAYPGYEIYGDGKQHMAGHPHGGMKLRDVFAAAALQGILANPNTVEPFKAEEIWKMASAMIEARGRK